MYKVALIGNPNCGKTTIFNELTGSHQRVGNWPGVTVEKIIGNFEYKGKKIEITDLPGTYSFNPETTDEQIARNYVLENSNEIFINILDSTNLKRSLLLTLDLLEVTNNVILVLNMYDELKEKNISIDIDKFSKILNIPIVTSIGNKGIGIDNIKEEILKFKQSSKKFNLPVDDQVDEIIYNIIKQINLDDINKKWIAKRVLSNDLNIINKLNDDSLLNEIKNIRKKYYNINSRDIAETILEAKYAYIEGLYKEISKKEINILKKYDISKQIDKILTNRILGIPIFIGILWVTFQSVFTIGAPLSDLIGKGIDLVSLLFTNLFTTINAPEWINSLVVNGIIGGVGNILVFLPSIMILFFMITLLEDSGYMARAAFMMDKVMHLLGLHGKSFIPFVLGFGCNVPAILATRTLATKKDRILTIMVLPLMSCSARLPIYVMFTSIFFKQNKGLVILSLYLTGSVLAIIVARIFKKLFFQSETAPLIMEIPPYRTPHLKSVWRITWFRSKSFLKKMSTIILLATVIIWFLASFPFGVEYASKETIIGQIGSLLAPIFSTAGFGDWQATVSLIFGIMAKEIVVSTMGVVYGAQGALDTVLQNHFTAISAYSFMLMTLIYIPCVATISAIKKEAGAKWAVLATSYTLFLAWLVSTLFYQIATLIMA